MRHSGMVFLFLLPLTASADTVKCHVTDAATSSAMAAFVGGTMVTSLDGASATFHAERGGKQIELSVISPRFVSNYRAARSACNYGEDTYRRSDGSLSAIDFHFDDCVHRDAADPSLTGYVRAEIGFNFESKTGSYHEIFLTPRGPVPSAFANFEDCATTRE